MKICPYCKEPNDNDNKTCLKCGHVFKNEIIDTSPVFKDSSDAEHIDPPETRKNHKLAAIFRKKKAVVGVAISVTAALMIVLGINSLNPFHPDLDIVQRDVESSSNSSYTEISPSTSEDSYPSSEDDVFTSPPVADSSDADLKEEQGEKYLSSEWAKIILDLLKPKATFTASEHGIVQFVMQAKSKTATYDDVYNSYRSILKVKVGMPEFSADKFGVQNIVLVLKDGAGNVVYTVSMDCSSSPTPNTEYINPKYTEVMEKVFKR